MTPGIGFGRRPVHVISANERRTSDKHPASSPDGLVVFQTYTNLINSERETLWARHNALILANSLIIGALAISPAELWENKWAALAMLGAGLVICTT